MKKRRIITGTVVAMVLVLIAVSVVLGAYVGSFRARVEVEEPIKLEQVSEPVSPISPGDTVWFGGNVYNTGSRLYGLELYGLLHWTWLKTGEVVEISIEDLEFDDEGEALIEMAGGPPLGTICIFVNAKKYNLGDVLDIEPGEVCFIEAIVTTSLEIQSGILVSEVLVSRVAPASG